MAACLLLAGSCGIDPLVPQTRALGLSDEIVTGQIFQHRVFSDSERAPAGTKIILIDGDGIAFTSRTVVADDPTPRYSVLLELLPEFSKWAPTFYLGRPCYHDLQSQDPRCHPKYWTTARYGEEVVSSTSDLVQVLAAGERVLLVGVSGGGVLAVEIAKRLQGVVGGVVTYGAPLDLMAWVTHHGYSPLVASLDPATTDSHSAILCQMHLFGTRDVEVPVGLVQAWNYPDEHIRFVRASHHRGWRKPLLSAVREQLRRCNL